MTAPPVPDPTVLTTEAQARAIAAIRDYADGQFDVLRQRLNGMDVATQVLNETVNRTPTAIQIEIAHLRELFEEMFRSVQTQFRERDTRSERESKDNKVAVDAAFAAQKEAAAKQDEGNLKAIDKSERATAETIKTNAELTKTVTDAQTRISDDLKERIVKLETAAQSRSEVRTERQAGSGQVVAYAVAAISLVGLLVTVFVALRG